MVVVALDTSWLMPKSLTKHAALRVQQQVQALDVTMQHTLGVQARYAKGSIMHQRRGMRHAKRRRAAVEHLAQRAAFRELHDHNKPVLFIVLAHAAHLDDVRVGGQPRHQRQLAVQRVCELAALRHRERAHVGDLRCHCLAQVGRPVYGRAPATPERLVQQQLHVGRRDPVSTHSTVACVLAQLSLQATPALI